MTQAMWAFQIHGTVPEKQPQLFIYLKNPERSLQHPQRLSVEQKRAGAAVAPSSTRDAMEVSGTAHGT